ncbi:MAG: helix-turn-helix transcriptional regulator [Gammaproteobacteria bacterium]|nr:helix-turn-helix transcriptional regulator [Gammaproteobacteria bacterium]
MVDVMNHSARVDGSLLKQDRRGKRLTQEVLAMEADVSTSTVTRAEAGSCVSRHSLDKLASVLDHTSDRYILEGRPVESLSGSLVPSLDGEWTSFYVEDDIKTEPYVVEEHSALETENSIVSAVFETITPEESRIEHLRDGRQIRSVFVGSTTIEGWVLPAGYAQFQLLCLRNDDWMDGVVTWYDYEIVSSRYVWIRNNSCLFDQFRKTALNLMNEEIQLFKKRRLTTLKLSDQG